MTNNQKVLKKLTTRIEEYISIRGKDEILNKFIELVLIEGESAYNHFQIERPNEKNVFDGFSQNSQILGLGRKYNVKIKG